MNASLTRLALMLLIVTTIGCDRVTKHFAAESLAGEPRQSFLADTVRLEYVENSGAFLSLGADLPPPVRTALFTVGNGLILIGTVVLAVRRRWTGTELFGLGLVFAGGASNLADRIARGSVIDFMNVGLGSLRTGIFNVADVAIMAGVLLLVLTHLRTGHEPRPVASDPESAG